MSTNNPTQVFTADVIQATTKDWSTVVGSGGGYYALPISINTYHRRITEMWVRLSDGRDIRLDIAGDFPALSGHRIACLIHSGQIWAARNFNTGTIQWLVIADSLTGRFKYFWHWIIIAGFVPAILCAFVIQEFQSPTLTRDTGHSLNVPTTPHYIIPCLLALAVLAIGTDIIRYFIHRTRRASYQSLINSGHAKLLNVAVESSTPSSAHNL